MDLLAVELKLNVPVEAGLTPLDLTAIQFSLSVSPVMLASIAAGGEGLLAELAFEWALARMNSLMHLEVRLAEEFTTTDA